MNAATPTPSLSRRKILIVDDDPSLVHVLARTLLDAAQLHFAVRGVDALRKLDTHTPDVMLVDVDMPDMNGYELIEQMQRNPKNRHTQVIMVTSHTEDLYRKRAMALGAVDFFVKPINRQQIRERVDQILNPPEMETIELSLSPHGDFSFKSDQPVIAAPVSAPAPRASADPAAQRTDAITSELFERMTAILEQTESIRAAATGGMDMGRIARIEEECAEVIQLLVTLSDPNA
ncbi:response regulator [Hydrogenophaga sp.]|uniref:response regulator n=1 Tax=Hydrogenophaga sp. TaxID=1904254 RepID=UPI003D0E7AE5